MPCSLRALSLSPLRFLAYGSEASGLPLPAIAAMRLWLGSVRRCRSGAHVRSLSPCSSFAGAPAFIHTHTLYTIQHCFRKTNQTKNLLSPFAPRLGLLRQMPRLRRSGSSRCYLRAQASRGRLVGPRRGMLRQMPRLRLAVPLRGYPCAQASRGRLGRLRQGVLRQTPCLQPAAPSWRATALPVSGAKCL